jgi:hypothetical protein
MGAGNGIRLASLPAILLLTPWGAFTRGLVRQVGFSARRANVGSLRPLAARRAADRQSRTNAMPPRFTRVSKPQWLVAVYRVTAGRDSLPNTARLHDEAPMTALAVAGASFVARIEPWAPALTPTPLPSSRERGFLTPKPGANLDRRSRVRTRLE